MGDRMVVGFQESSVAPPVWLYSHWGGYSRVEDLAKALEAARPRWSDPAYATRIAMSSIIGESWNQELGFGISAGVGNFCMPDYDDVHLVDWSKRTVTLQTLEGEDICTFDFEAFIKSAKREGAAV